ncbi:MAG: hypothetical protein NZP34_07220 [Caldilineales bacterium]|nr:hypothetical protein [Caldilineales bacterium]MCX7853161.1 hypothetical protein [Caldilineales bacterium]
MSIAETYQHIRRLAPALARCTQQAVAQAHNEADMPAVRANLDELKGEEPFETGEAGEEET